MIILKVIYGFKMDLSILIKNQCLIIFQEKILIDDLDNRKGKKIFIITLH